MELKHLLHTQELQEHSASATLCQEGMSLPGPAPLETVSFPSSTGEGREGAAAGTRVPLGCAFRGGWRQMASLTACVTEQPEKAATAGAAECLWKGWIYGAVWK